MSKLLISSKNWCLYIAKSWTSTLKHKSVSQSYNLPTDCLFCSFLGVIFSCSQPKLEVCKWDEKLPMVHSSSRPLVMYQLMFTTSIFSLSKLYCLLPDAAMAQLIWQFVASSRNTQESALGYLKESSKNLSTPDDQKKNHVISLQDQHDYLW